MKAIRQESMERGGPRRGDASPQAASPIHRRVWRLSHHFLESPSPIFSVETLLSGLSTQPRRQAQFMKSSATVNAHEPLSRKTAWLVLLAIGAGLTSLLETAVADTITVWDTGAHLADAANADNRSAWKAVPANLFALEAEPLKAASDPGYYGLEYAFKGDAVVENRNVAAVFWTGRGRVAIYSKSAGQGDAGLGKKVLEFAPLQAKAQPAKISRCEILHHGGDEAVVEVTFSVQGSGDVSAEVSLGRDEIVAIKPSAKMKGISLHGPIEYGVVPGFVGDDLIYNPAEYPSADTLSIPAENVFVGLLNGSADEVVMTWPAGKQQMKLRLANDPQSRRAIESIDFDNDGQSFYVAALSAPGIWHREELKPAFLEKDVPLTWKRPFAAKWKTQLSEGGVKTTYAFRNAKGTVWRGVAGSYDYPAWFDGESAFFHLGKKVPPKGEAIIYFLEGSDSTSTVLAPVDVMKATLGRPMSDSIIDVAGQKLRTHHRRGADGVHRACTCGCTEAIQAIFDVAGEVDKKDDVKEALGDMNYFVERHLARIDEYRHFAADMIQFLQAKKTASPEFKEFVENLAQTVQRIPQEYDAQKETMQSLEHTAELTRQTMALTATASPNNRVAYKKLLDAWRKMGGAQDGVVAQCHTITRSIFQEAGYGCANEPKAVALANEVRARCRQVLRNPDGYEIWPNY